MSRFAGKVAIITGSSFGIGRSTALLFGKEGARVTVTGRNGERLKDSRQKLLDAGVKESHINTVIADITTAEGQDLVIKSTLAKFGGKIDILVNNAGAMIPDRHRKTNLEQGLDTYQKIMDLNVQCVIEMTQKIRPHLAKSQGEIVNVSSIAGCPLANVRNPYYAVAKCALNQYSRSAAVELINEGIRVNVVSPGSIKTGFVTAAGLDEQSAEMFYKIIDSNRSSIPRGSSGTPEEIAKVIAFLADRDASSFIIGQNIIADGGSSLVMGMHAVQNAALESRQFVKK